jgi:predicted glutamine amidotransferase
MCRLLGYCAHGPVSVAGLLGEPGLHAFTALSALHRDGWGVAWYGADGPHARRGTGQAAGDPGYHELARASLGDMGLVHLRWATPGLGISERNSHPFCYGDFTFAHNGAIHPQDRLGEILPPGWQQRLRGTTDSERYFLCIMARLHARRGDLGAVGGDLGAGSRDLGAVGGDLGAGSDDLVAAISGAAGHIDRLLRPNSLNAILLSPAALYAVCWHYPDRLPAAELRRRAPGHSEAEIAAYFDLSYRATGNAVVVASSGWPQEGWVPIPNRHVLVVDRATLRTSVRPLAAGAAAVAEVIG